MNENKMLEKSDYVRSSANRQRRLRLVNIFVPALIGFFLIFLITIADGDFFFNYVPVPKQVLLFSAPLFLVYASLSLVMEYLQTGFKNSNELQLELEKYQRNAEGGNLEWKNEFDKLAEELRRENQGWRDEFASTKNVTSFLNEGDRLLLIDELMKQINSETGDKILAELKIEVEKKYSREIREKEFSLQFKESRARLSSELQALGRRGNLNLGLGAITTVVGLSMLGYGVFFGMVNAPKDFWGFVYHFFPRLTLVLMIELFAYFFLSLYKTSLAEIKYFQNEITNIEAKQVALRAALAYEDKGIVGSVLEKLAATERNHIISKDQTTVELEKAKIEKDAKGELFKFFSDFLQKRI